MTTAVARTVEEMCFAAAVESCAGCGLREVGRLEVDGDGTRWTCRGSCPRCGVVRTVHFETAGDPVATTIEFDELGRGVSKLLSAEQFFAVIEEFGLGIPDDPKGLTPRQRQRVAKRIERALVSAGELLKLVPPPSQPQSSNPKLVRENVMKEYKRLFMLRTRYAPPNTIPVEALEAHRDWIQRGAKGDDGYLKIEGKELVGQRYGSWPLSFVRIAHSDLTNVNMSLSLVNEADLENDVFTRAYLGGTSFANSFIRGGSWTKASMARANFNGVEVRATDFSRSELDRSTWFNAKVTGARFDAVHFGNAQLDGAMFTQCSFRNASFAKYMSEPTPTSAGAHFVECDFSGVDFTDRDLGHTTFTHCLFDGARGKPAASDGLVAIGAVDTAALLRQLT